MDGGNYDVVDVVGEDEGPAVSLSFSFVRIRRLLKYMYNKSASFASTAIQHLTKSQNSPPVYLRIVFISIMF